MITIRRSMKDDDTAVVDLINTIMDSEFHDAKHAYPTEDVECIEKAYGGIGEAFFVAVDNRSHKVVGTVAIKKEDGRVALLRRLFVAPTHRNLKIGKRLIDRALDFCRERAGDAPGGALLDDRRQKGRCSRAERRPFLFARSAGERRDQSWSTGRPALKAG